MGLGCHDAEGDDAVTCVTNRGDGNHDQAQGLDLARYRGCGCDGGSDGATKCKQTFKGCSTLDFDSLLEICC